MNEKGKKIIALRKQGKTCGEIEKILGLPKSTVGWWVRGIKISAKIKEKTLERCREKWRKNIIDYNNTYSQIRSEKAKQIREQYKNDGVKEIKKLAPKDLKIIGSMLYWAEGNNKNRHLLRLANANPEIIKIMMLFFRKTCNIPDAKIKARIHLYPDTNQQKVTNFWKKITGLTKQNFQKPQTQISKASKKKRRINTLPYGTLHLTAGNTKIACKVKGWIQGISEQIINNAGVV